MTVISIAGMVATLASMKWLSKVLLSWLYSVAIPKKRSVILSVGFMMFWRNLWKRKWLSMVLISLFYLILLQTMLYHDVSTSSVPNPDDIGLFYAQSANYSEVMSERSKLENTLGISIFPLVPSSAIQLTTQLNGFLFTDTAFAENILSYYTAHNSLANNTLFLDQRLSSSVDTDFSLSIVVNSRLNLLQEYSVVNFVGFMTPTDPQFFLYQNLTQFEANEFMLLIYVPPSGASKEQVREVLHKELTGFWYIETSALDPSLYLSIRQSASYDPYSTLIQLLIGLSFLMIFMYFIMMQQVIMDYKRLVISDQHIFLCVSAVGTILNLILFGVFIGCSLVVRFLLKVIDPFDYIILSIYEFGFASVLAVSLLTGIMWLVALSGMYSFRKSHPSI